ncbi:MAG: GTPase [Candidatus Hodarchaeales archaeon]
MTASDRKFKWYRFSIARRIRLLEGEELVKELEEIIEDIKSKKLDQKIGKFKLQIRELEDLIAETKAKPKQRARQYDPFHIPRSGDGRIALFGISNVGKSTLMNYITNTDVKTGNFLHTTRTALAGTLEYDNLKIQIVDLPGFLDFKEDWVISKQIVRVARTSDAILLVIDLSMNIDRQYAFLIEQLENAKLIVNGESMYKLGIIAAKGDLPGSKENYELLKERTSLPIYPISIKSEKSLEKLKKNLFRILEVIRVYTKPPRKKSDYKRPFVCPQETTIQELAEKIHKDFLILFRHAKVWGSSVEFPGQQVGLEHVLMDSDVVEITLNRKK